MTEINEADQPATQEQLEEYFLQVRKLVAWAIYETGIKKAVRPGVFVPDKQQALVVVGKDHPEWANAIEFYRQNNLQGITQDKIAAKAGIAQQNVSDAVTRVQNAVNMVIGRDYEKHIEQKLKDTHPNGAVTRDGSSGNPDVWMIEDGVLSVYSCKAHAFKGRRTKSIPIQELHAEIAFAKQEMSHFARVDVFLQWTNTINYEEGTIAVDYMNPPELYNLHYNADFVPPPSGDDPYEGVTDFMDVVHAAEAFKTLDFLELIADAANQLNRDMDPAVRSLVSRVFFYKEPALSQFKRLLHWEGTIGALTLALKAASGYFLHKSL